MSRRIYPHRRVRYWYSYAIDEICELYEDFNLHPQTVRKWVKQGLQTIDQGKPTLIYGYELILYLKRHNTANKRSTEFDQMFCMTCKDARPIFKNEIAVEQEAQYLRVRGRCRECKGLMFQNYRLLDFAELRRKFKLVDVLQLYDDGNPSGKTHIPAQTKTQANESLQGELF